VELGAVGNQNAQDRVDICVVDFQGAGALAVMVLSDVYGIARVVGADEMAGTPRASLMPSSILWLF
jgi:hypothetical protein